MKINWLTLKDFRGFRDCEITFPESSNIAVFIGINGAGKSAILDAISILLNILSKQIRSQKVSKTSLFNDVNQDDVNFHAEQYKVQIEFSSKVGNPSLFDSKYLPKTYTMSLVYSNNLHGTFNDFIEMIQSFVSKEDTLLNLPIFVYYPVNRNTINDNTKKERYTRGYKFPQFFAYENAFNRNINSFNDFSKWFRQEEDLENQLQRDFQNFEYRNKRLELVRYAIDRFLNEFGFARFSNLRIERERIDNNYIDYYKEPITSSLIIDKDGKKIKFSQLSSGEKMMLSLVVDIARRLAIANPSLENKLEGEGIVLIDEVDLHLHPQWQRKLLPALTHTFPNIQFIVTTHSPQVLSHVSKESVFLLEDNKISDREIYTEGRDSNSILQDVFHVPELEKEYEMEIKEIYTLISNYDIENATDKLEKLKEKRGEYDREVNRMQSYIDIL